MANAPPRPAALATADDPEVRALASRSPAPPAGKGAAGRADRHALYQRAVQDPATDIALLVEIFEARTGRAPEHLREDFCGTAWMAATWVAGGRERSAEGFDIDPAPLAWGIQHNLEALDEGALERLRLVRGDVRLPSERAPDLRVAQNFSWQVFSARAELLAYLKQAREDLAEGGLLFLDIYGGPEAVYAQEEITDHDDFSYVWDQQRYTPVTGAYRCAIHFRFPDGSALEEAFSYEWRLWTLPELVDLLDEAGFRDIQTWWEGTDEDGEGGNGEFHADPEGESCLAWVTYVTAWR